MDSTILNPAISVQDLLAPITPERPSGDDLDGTPEWLRIREARRADDPYARDKWDRPLKVADWPLTLQLATDALKTRTKDLRLAIWLTEASTQVDEFHGLKFSLELVTGLIERFWDAGLYPGLAARGKALQWLGHSDKLALQVRLLPLTRRSDAGRDVSLADWDQALRIGYARDTPANEAAANRKQDALAKGGVSRDMFELALKQTSVAAFQSVLKDIQDSIAACDTLNKLVDDKLKDDGPSLAATKEVLGVCLELVKPHAGVSENALEKKNSSRNVNSTAVSSPDATQGLHPQPILNRNGQDGYAAASRSWAEAESLISGGQLEQGLAEMTRLAAAEHGRGRFLRRLRLAELCLQVQRRRLAVSILEDLAKQVEDSKVDTWESPEVIGRVWGQLGRCYRNTDKSERGRLLLAQLCKLDPWQAMYWDDEP